MSQVNSEFYTGWLDHWGDQHAVVDAQKVSRVLAEMLTMGANVNMYVSPNTHHTFLLFYLFLIVNKSHDKAKTHVSLSSTPIYSFRRQNVSQIFLFYFLKKCMFKLFLLSSRTNTVMKIEGLLR